MILDIPLVADLIEISQRRQQLIDQKKIEANHCHSSHEYQPADEVLVLTHNMDKLEPRAHGPYRVEHIHVNSTITIRRAPGITERINIAESNHIVVEVFHPLVFPSMAPTIQSQHCSNLS
jgi:hypothetical protein